MVICRLLRSLTPSSDFNLHPCFLVQLNKHQSQDALSAVDAAKACFKRVRSDQEFDYFYDTAFKIAEQNCIGQPELPRYRRHSLRFEDGVLYVPTIATLTLKLVTSFVVS